MSKFGCGIDAECEGETVSVWCKRPKWEDVYTWYMEGAPYKLSLLYGQSHSLSESSATHVFYAVNGASWEANGGESITDVKDLKDWLSNDEIWGPADIEFCVSKKEGLVALRKKIKWMSGVYIILSGPNQSQGHATLWVSALKNVVGGDNYIDEGGTVYFWGLSECNPIKNPYVFSQEEFDEYIKYIRKNAENEANRDDCINTVVNSMQILLDDEGITLVEREQMDDQMTFMKKMGYADGWEELDFKDNSKKKNFDENSPAEFLDKRLSEIIIQKLDSDAGYYFFGLSIMDGFHSTMVVVNNTESGSPKFNIYDQFGSFVNMWCRLCDTTDWYSGTEMDAALVTYVKGGRPLQRSERTVKCKTITRVTPIKHNWGN